MCKTERDRLKIFSVDNSQYYVQCDDITHTHTPVQWPFSKTTWVSQYQKVKTNLDVTEARDSEWQWHQLGYMQVCASLQTDIHASTPPLGFFTGRMPFLPPNQHQSTEGNDITHTHTRLTALFQDYPGEPVPER